MKKWIFYIVVTLSIIAGGSAYAMNEIIHAQMPGLNDASKLVLQRTTMETIENAQDYTGPISSFVFFGTDKLQRPMWAFATKGKVLGSVYQSEGLSRSQAENIALKNQYLQKVIRSTPGMTDPNRKNILSQATSGAFIWELYGIDSNKQYKYVYLDFYNGKVIWQYELK